MTTRIEWSRQVADFVGGLAPDPRRRVRAALRGLEGGRGDVKALQGDLLGYRRWRVAQYRVIYREAVEGGERVVRCLYAAERDVVYEMFSRMRLDELAEPG